MNENYEREPVVTDGGFGSLQGNLNANFGYIEDAFDNVDKAIGTAIIFGTYTGNGQNSQSVDVVVDGQRVEPKAVEVYRADGVQNYFQGNYLYYYGGFVIDGEPCVTTFNDPVLSIIPTGFLVYRNNNIFEHEYSVSTNENGVKYYYKAYVNGTIQQ